MATHYGKGITLTQRGDGRWRLRWYDPPGSRAPEDRHEKTYRADAFDDAEEHAEKLAELFRAGTTNAAQRLRLLEATYEELLDHWLDPANHANWSPNHAYENAKLADKWVRPVIGRTPGGLIDKDAYTRVFAAMRVAGGWGSMDRVRRILSAVHTWGVERDRLSPGRFPVKQSDVAKPKVATAGTDAEFVPEGMRPDTPRVRRLITALEEEVAGGAHWWRGLHGEVAAWPGLRLGETFALRACHVRRTDGRRRLKVNWQYIEQRTVTLTAAEQAQAAAHPDELLWLAGKVDQAFWPRRPGVVLKRPKGEKVRVAVYPSTMTARLLRRCDEVAGTPGSPLCPDCGDPDCALLFPAPEGGPARRSTFGRDVARKAYALTQQDENARVRWPKGKTGKWLWRFHDLRHHSAVYHLDTLKLPVSDAATLLGHTKDVLMKRYYGSVDGVLERAEEASDKL